MSIDSQSFDEQRETRSRERTRERLYEAALSVFAEHGVNGASIEMITEAAGFTRGAFYSNFESKEELFFELAEREGQKTLKTLGDTVDSLSKRFTETDPDALTKEVISELVGLVLSGQYTDPRWYLVQSEFKLFALRDRDAAKRLLESQRKFTAQITNFVRDVLDALGLEFTMDADAACQVIINTFLAAFEEATLLDRKNVVKAAQKIAMRTIPALVSAITRPTSR